MKAKLDRLEELEHLQRTYELRGALEAPTKEAIYALDSANCPFSLY